MSCNAIVIDQNDNISIKRLDLLYGREILLGGKTIEIQRIKYASGDNTQLCVMCCWV